MAKLTIGQKSARVLQLLQGLTKARAAAALSAHGFGQADWDEGWSLLRGATGAWLAREQPPSATTDVVQRLDTWENRWFPIAQATLARHFPAVHERVFLNLSQVAGVEVVVSVSTFVDRLTALSESSEGAAALDMLAKRGLTEAVLDEAKALLEQFGTLKDVEPALQVSADTALARDEAEARMWAWYLEWSTIARSVISDRRVLRSLGFLSSSRSSDADVEEDADDVEDEVEAPALNAA